MLHISNSDDLSRVQNDLCLRVSCFQAVSKSYHLGNSRSCIGTRSSINRFEAGLLMPGDYSLPVCIFSFFVGLPCLRFLALKSCGRCSFLTWGAYGFVSGKGLVCESLPNSLQLSLLSSLQLSLPISRPLSLPIVPPLFLS